MNNEGSVAEALREGMWRSNRYPPGDQVVEILKQKRIDDFKEGYPNVERKPGAFFLMGKVGYGKGREMPKLEGWKNDIHPLLSYKTSSGLYYYQDIPIVLRIYALREVVKTKKSQPVKLVLVTILSQRSQNKRMKLNHPSPSLVPVASPPATAPVLSPPSLVPLSPLSVPQSPVTAAPASLQDYFDDFAHLQAPLAPLQAFAPDLIAHPHDLIAHPHDLIAHPHDLIAPPHDLVAPSHGPIPSSYGPVAPSHAPFAHSHGPIAPSHEPIAPSHEPITPSHVPIAPSHDSLVPQSGPPQVVPQPYPNESSSWEDLEFYIKNYVLSDFGESSESDSIQVGHHFVQK